MKVDTARYFILHHYGGVYADMDIEYTPKENASLTQIVTRVSLTNKTNLAIIFHNCTDNSLMASTPNASFWFHVFEKWNKATKFTQTQANCSQCQWCQHAGQCMYGTRQASTHHAI
jgi:mannosyltransferase OCH1-like enzyme